jgi:hypothetical protein
MRSASAASRRARSTAISTRRRSTVAASDIDAWKLG